jgi:uncharacterized protein (DUF1697 family)
MMPATHVALLRGVNVGGKNKLPMKELAGMFVDAGCKDVKTYIQSGNVVFRALPRRIEKLPVVIAAEIKNRFGYQTPIVLRTTEQMRAVVSGNPFLGAGTGVDWLHVLFLACEPDSDRVGKLDPQRSPPDLFTVRGGDIYLYLPNGPGRTRLTNGYFDTKLDTISTGRNWRTVVKLLEIMEAPSK